MNNESKSPAAPTPGAALAQAPAIPAPTVQGDPFHGFDIANLPPILISCVSNLWPGCGGVFWESALENMPERIDQLIARAAPAQPIAPQAAQIMQTALEHIATDSTGDALNEARCALISAGAWTDEMFDPVAQPIADVSAPTERFAVLCDAVAEQAKAVSHDEGARYAECCAVRIRALAADVSAPTDSCYAHEGMHGSLFVKVWGEAGGGDTGRAALAEYAFNIGKQAARAAAPVSGPTEPLVTLILGGIDGNEYDSWDLEVISSKAIEALQSKLVTTSEPVLVHLYPAAPVSGQGASIDTNEFQLLLLAAHKSYPLDQGPYQYHQDRAALVKFIDSHRPTDDELWDATLRDRDTYHEWADKLAEGIAKHFGIEIGEHSNQNLPWAEALEHIDSRPRSSEVSGQGASTWEWAPGLKLADDEVIHYSQIYQTAEGPPVMTDSSQHSTWNVASVFKRAADGVDSRNPVRILTVEPSAYIDSRPRSEDSRAHQATVDSLTADYNTMRQQRDELIAKISSSEDSRAKVLEEAAQIAYGVYQESTGRYSIGRQWAAIQAQAGDATK